MHEMGSRRRIIIIVVIVASERGRGRGVCDGRRNGSRRGVLTIRAITFDGVGGEAREIGESQTDVTGELHWCLKFSICSKLPRLFKSGENNFVGDKPKSREKRIRNLN